LRVEVVEEYAAVKEDVVVEEDAAVEADAAVEDFLGFFFLRCSTFAPVTLLPPKSCASRS
jgi:hypothetical protein